MRIYYAHPISDYGTTHEQVVQRSISLMLPAFIGGYEPWIVNPNEPLHQKGYEERGMDHFMDVIDGCDGCVFDSFPGGIIGSGVAMEVKRFLDQGKPVWGVVGAFCGYGFQRISELPACVATRETTREMSKLYRAMPNGGRR